MRREFKGLLVLSLILGTTAQWGSVAKASITVSDGAMTINDQGYGVYPGGFSVTNSAYY